jgi:tetratricopeptide (TPR) repeat protein
MDDIFSVQDEIATAIAHVLRVRLVGGTLGRQEGGTPNREAYELYLRALHGEDWDSRESLDAVEGYLREAIQIDPEYGLAWAELASVNMVRAEYGYLDSEEAYSRARQFTERALEFAPDSARAHSELQNILIDHDWNTAAAEVEAQRALALDSTDSDVLNSAGRLSIALGRLEDARRHFRAALERDPLNDYVTYNFALTYYLERQFIEAEKILRRLLKVSPQFPWTRVLLAQTILLQGKTDEALAILREDSDEGMRLAALPVVLQAAGHHRDADAALRDQIAYCDKKSASFVAVSYAHRGDYDLALKWLERAYEQRDPSLFEVIADPLFGGMLNDPRYKAFRRKMNLPDLSGVG